MPVKEQRGRLQPVITVCLKLRVQPQTLQLLQHGADCRATDSAGW